MRAGRLIVVFTRFVWPDACDGPAFCSLDVQPLFFSPLTRLLDDGAYSASVSIRSGRGQASSDRVLRLIGRFTTADGALRHAAAQGRAWVHAACGV